MKKFIFGCFAVIILSASAISATNKAGSTIIYNHSFISSDTTPHKMHDKKKKSDSSDHMMDTSMNQGRDSM